VRRTLVRVVAAVFMGVICAQHAMAAPTRHQMPKINTLGQAQKDLLVTSTLAGFVAIVQVTAVKGKTLWPELGGLTLSYETTGELDLSHFSYPDGTGGSLGSSCKFILAFHGSNTIPGNVTLQAQTGCDPTSVEFAVTTIP
jgi:hypothetical protein